MAATTRTLTPQDLAYALPGAFANYSSGGQWRYARHLKLIEDKIMPLTQGIPIRLMVSITPRSGKSMFLSENFPAWYLGRFPRDRVILLSYQQTFAQQFGRKARNKLKEFGPEIFGVTVADDAQAVGSWETNYGGGMQSVGAEGAVTGKGANCTVGSTLVLTSRGNMRIDDLVAMHDKPQVLSFNHATNKVEFRDIIATRTTNTTTLVDVSTSGGRSLSCTPEHPIYCIQRGYTPASCFVQREAALSYEASQIKRESLSRATQYSCSEQQVYDLQVEGNHNYFANGILVHNCLIVDDIIKGRDEALNAKYLDTLFGWYTTDVRSRLEPGGSVIILNTRWSTGDLVGRLREQSKKSARADKWEEIVLPALAEEDDPLGRSPGEALWPERFSREDLLAIKESGISDYFWRAVYQQRPTPLEGNLININWFRRYRVIPSESERDMTVMSFDTASKDNELNDYTVIQVWAIKDGFYYLLHQVREKMKYPKLLKTAVDLRSIWKPNAMVIEDKGSGIALIQSLKEIGAPVIGITPTQSKLMRFEAETPAIQGGQVFLPEDAAQAPWLQDLEDELKSFPDSIYKDAADCMSQFLLFARLKMARAPLEVW